MSEHDDGGPAYPTQTYDSSAVFNGVGVTVTDAPGMSLRDWFAGQALANPAICTGHEPEWHLAEWFPDQIAISKAQIVAKQAETAADAMLKARKS